MTFSIPNYFDDKFQFMMHCQMQSSELESLPVYEYYELRKRLADHLKRQEEQNKAQSQQHQTATKLQHSAPKMPKFKIPKM